MRTAPVFFADKPYISNFFRTTVRDNAIPVVCTDSVKSLNLYSGTKIISETETVKLAQDPDNLRIYTTSENSIGWISTYLAFTGLPEKIDLFKNKLKFRELTKPLFPDLYFKEVRLEELRNIRLDDVPLPCIIKPAIGFFSMGVYKVTKHSEWSTAIDAIIDTADTHKGIYPEEVLDTSTFIIEECIQGDEFAVDAYFDSTGEPVVLSILEHLFSSDIDVGDRIYTTSKEIIENNIEEFTQFAYKIGRLAGVKNFPVHIELRRYNNTLLPIEVNPLRFGGWCTTADMSFMAFGFNPYLYYASQIKPDWTELLKGKDKKLYSIIVLGNSTGVENDKIESFNYQKLLLQFEKPIELRKIDYKEYSVFGFLFTETSEQNYSELRNILKSDLREFVTTGEP
jgi:hypothetical protein